MILTYSIYTCIFVYICRSLFIVFPLDEYYVTQYHMNRDILMNVYYVIYTLVLIFLFLLLPFSYFYEEFSSNAYLRNDYSLSSTKIFILSTERMLYWVCALFATFMVVLLLNGIRYGYFHEGQTFVGLMDNLFDTQHGGYQFLLFLIATLLFVGTSSWFYVSIGIGSIPFTLLFNDAGYTFIDRILSNENESNDFSPGVDGRGGASGGNSYQSFTDRDEEIDAIYTYSQTGPSIWEGEEIPITTPPKRSCISKIKCKHIIISLQRTIGVLILLIYTLYIISLSITSVDKAANSKCAWTCGFSIDFTSYYNPLDHFLVFISKAFPLDIFFMGLVQFLLFAAVLQGDYLHHFLTTSFSLHNSIIITIIFFLNMFLFKFFSKV